MRIIDNVTAFLGDDLKSSLQGADRLSIAAAYFSIYAYEALRDQLEDIDEFRFIFTSPTFVPNGAVDKIRKERRQFFIPSEMREGAVSGGEFEIKLRNKMTQRAVARECANWIRRKAQFRSNATSAPMQQFAHVGKEACDTAYTPLSGFTAVDLGYQTGDALSSLSQAIDEPQFTKTYLSLFDQLWADSEKLSDVTAQVLDHIESVYQESSPKRIYFVILYNLFSDFLIVK